jgi:molecular chaperone DnaK
MADRERRRPFEARAAAWVAQAKKDVDARFATIWGLDLGTTKQSAATPNSVVVISTTQSDNG